MTQRRLPRTPIETPYDMAMRCHHHPDGCGWWIEYRDINGCLVQLNVVSFGPEWINAAEGRPGSADDFHGPTCWRRWVNLPPFTIMLDGAPAHEVLASDDKESPS